MEIRVRHYSIVINCVIFIPCLLAKPFSLNEAIAEEVRGKQSLDTSSQSAGIITQQEPTIIQKVQPSKARVYSVPDNKISSLQYKRTFKIRTPIKPKRLKRQQKLFYRNKNKTAKRAIDSDEIFNSKYIPLLKSLSLLFDHILNTDTSESYELATNENEKDDRISKNNEAQCSCTFTPNTNLEKLESQETATTPLTTFTVKIPDIKTDITTKATTSPAHNTASGNFRSFERNKNLPLLFTRNTISSRRNNNGLRKRSGTTDYGSFERHLAGDYGDNERYAGHAENTTVSQYHEEYPNSTPRNYASSHESSRRISGNYIRNPNSRRTLQDQIYAAEENTREEIGRNIFEGQNQLEIRGHETESTIPIPNIDSGLRRHTIENQTNETKTTSTYKDYEKSNNNITFNSTSHKRFLSRDGPHTSENKKNRRADETVGLKIPFEASEPVKSKIPVVTIIDGYSIARDVNGENKLTEKAIHIHT